MKLTIVLLTAVFLNVSAKVVSQNVTISGENIPLVKIFDQVKAQTGMVFLYPKSLLNGTKSISIHVQNMPLEDFLKIALKDQPLEYTLSFKSILLSRKTTNDGSIDTSLLPGLLTNRFLPVRILVLDSTGVPLRGASVTVKNGRISGVTNTEGIVSVNIVEGSVLLISFVGYETQSVIFTSSMQSSSGNIVIKLKPSITRLEEVEVTINTGYQTLPKERATGSFQVIDNKTINYRVSPDLLSRIDGITSGFLNDKRGSEPTMQIRGLSSLDFNTRDPLIIIDNFPYEGELSSINPNDVESVSILKDAAATSIWGSRAGNGVIVIITKKAKYSQPLQVSFNSNLSVVSRPNLFSAAQIPVADYIALEKYLFTNGNYDSYFDASNMPAISPVVEILNMQRSNTITQEEADKRINEFKKYDLRSDMETYLYRPAVSQQYFVNMNTGGANYRHLFSFGYDDVQTNLKGNGNKRFTLRTESDFNLSSKLTVKTGLLLIRDNGTENSGGNYNSFDGFSYSLPPYTRLADDNGNALPIDVYYRSVFTDTAGKGRLLDWKLRPVDELKNNDNTSLHYDAIVNLGADYKISKWLSLSGKYQYQYSLDHDKQYDNLNSYNTRDLVNRFTQITPAGIMYGVPKEGVLNQKRTEAISHNLRAQLNIDKSWGAHQITALAGAERRITNSDYEATTIYGYNKSSRSSQPINAKDRFPTYNDIYGDSYIPDARNLNSFDRRFVSLYSNLAYSYQKKYVLTLSARKDASNLFGVNTNKKGVPLWSAGGKWIISKASFYKSSILPELSFRTTFGFSGNVNNTVSALTLIQYQDGGTLNMPYVRLAASASPNLRWEKVRMVNLGVDFRFKNDRLAGSLEYYDKYSYDLFNTVYLDPTSGLSNIKQNSAAIKGKGIDLLLNSMIINGKFRWSVRLMHSYVSYKVTKNLAPPETKSLATAGDIIFPVLDYNPYSIFSFKWAGLDPVNGDPRGYLNGQVSKDYDAIISNTPIEEQKYHGSALPSHFGNLANTFNWRNITMNVNFSYKLNYFLRKPTLNSYSLFNGVSSKTADWLNRWQKPGDEVFTNTPSVIYPYNSSRDFFYNYSDITVIKADHVRFEDLYLSYVLPVKKISLFRSVELYAYGKNFNLLVWKANKDDIDPDVIYNVKPPFSISLGIKINLN